MLELPGLDEAAVRVVPHGDRWVQMGRHWMRIHAMPRNAVYTPQLEEGGPDLSTLTDARITWRIQRARDPVGFCFPPRWL